MQRLAYNVTGQTLRHHASPRQDTVGWVLEDLRPADGGVLGSGSAAVDPATEVTTAAAGPQTANARLIEMASTADFVVSTPIARVFYEIVSAEAGVRESFEIASIDTDDALLTVVPLAGSYPAGSTVRGLTVITAAIDASVLQDEARVDGDYPMRVVWSYADGTIHQEQVRIVREPEADMFVVPIAADCYAVFPGLDTRIIHHGHNVLAPIIRATIRQIRADALGRGFKIEQWLTGDQGHWAAVWRTILHLGHLGDFPGGIEPEQWMAYAKGEYDKRWNALTMGYGKAEVIERAADGTATSADGVSYRTVDFRDL